MTAYGSCHEALAKNMGTSVNIVEKYYSHLTPTLAANELRGKEHPGRV